MICIVLAGAVVAVYWQALAFGIVDFDDPGYAGDNSGMVNDGLTWQGVKWAFTTSHTANWHPLTWLSLMLDREIQGSGWTMFHVTNLLLHVTNTLLLFGVLRLLTGAQWASALVAALFGLHPTHVESVAWISERKDVLSTLFWLLTMWGYARWIKRGGAAWYGLVVGLLGVGLLAKPMLVTLPLVLLLLDFWPLRRLDEALQEPRSSRSPLRAVMGLVAEKVPLLVLSASSAVITAIVQHGGNVTDVGWRIRVLNTAISYARYLGKLLWPTDLCVLYPLPGWYGQPPWPLWVAALCAGLIAALTVGALALWRRAPFVTVGWLWYLGTLVPVIGLFIFVGNQAIADRYLYVPSIGIFIVIGWSLRAALLRWRRLTIPCASASLVALAALAAVSGHQVAVWRDSDTLFQHALHVTKRNYKAHAAYGHTLLREERFAAAEAQFQMCVDLVPTTPDARVDLAQSQIGLQKYASAVHSLERALELQPDNAPAHVGLAWISMTLGDNERALAHIERAIALDPDNEAFRTALRTLRSRMKRPE